MSGAIIPTSVEAVKDINPHLVFHNKAVLTVPVGPLTFAATQFSSTSYSTAGGTTTIAYTPNSTTTALGINMRVKWTLRVHVRALANDNGQVINYGITDCFRPYPVTQMMNTQTVTLNGTGITFTPQDILNIVLRRNMNSVKQAVKNSACPTMLDQARRWQDHIENPPFEPASGAGNIMGPVNNPMNSYGETLNSLRPPRGAFPLLKYPESTFTPGDEGEDHIDAEITEPLFVSPWDGGQMMPFSLAQIKNLTIVCTFGDSFKCWCHNNKFEHESPIVQNPYTDIISEFIASPILLIDVFSLPPTIALPKVLLYPYSRIQQFDTTFSKALPVPSQTASYAGKFVTNNIQLDSVPDYLLIAIQRNTSLVNPTVSNTFMRITSLAINYNTTTNQLASATEQQLFDYSLTGGTDANWLDQVSGWGSVISLKVSEQLTVGEFEKAPGIMAPANLYITGSFIDTRDFDEVDRSLNPVGANSLVAWIVAINNGIMTVAESTCITQANIISSADYLSAPAVAPPPTEEGNGNYTGGSLKRLASSAYKGAKSLGKNVVKGVETANRLLDAGNAAVAAFSGKGYGYGEGFMNRGQLVKRSRFSLDDLNY